MEKREEKDGVVKNAKGYNIQQVALGAGQNVQKEARGAL